MSTLIGTAEAVVVGSGSGPGPASPPPPVPADPTTCWQNLVYLDTFTDRALSQSLGCSTAGYPWEFFGGSAATLSSPFASNVGPSGWFIGADNTSTPIVFFQEPQLTLPADLRTCTISMWVAVNAPTPPALGTFDNWLGIRIGDDQGDPGLEFQIFGAADIVNGRYGAIQINDELTGDVPNANLPSIADTPTLVTINVGPTAASISAMGVLVTTTYTQSDPAWNVLELEPVLQNFTTHPDLNSGCWITVSGLKVSTPLGTCAVVDRCS